MTPVPDYSASLAFLRRWRPTGPWILTSIRPDRKAWETKTFGATEEERLLRWLEEHGKDRNVYFTVNSARPMDKKPEAVDVTALDWLHVDIDPRAGEDLGSERARILELLTAKLPQGVPRPTCVVFSGGGYQGFWRLREPLPLDGTQACCEDAKRWNMQLELLFGGDNCHNVDRIMRLPGTVNRPDDKKRKKGRTEELARVEFFEDSEHDLAGFVKAPEVQSAGTFDASTVKVSGNVPRVSLGDLPSGISDLVKVVIAQGRDPDNPNKFGTSRSEWVFWVCCEMVRAGCDDDTIYAVITDPDYAISDYCLSKGSRAQRHAVRQIGRARERAIDPWLQKLNDQYAVVGNVGGKCRIITEASDSFGDHRRTVIAYMSFGDFKNLHCNKKVDWVNGQGNVVSTPVGQWWIHHPNRREYNTVVFSPGADAPGSYNLWRGFAYDARPGDCSLFLEHVKANICRGQEDLYDYVMRWMATLVQQPAQPGHTALVLRGRQGTGKGVFAKTFGALLGRHFLPVSNPQHLVGNFNAHLQDCLLLYCDEAFFAGDKRHESVLKTLVTEDSIMIEPKGVNAQLERNYIHLVMASNEDWVVPVGLDDRRFLVLDVGEERKEDLPYFRAVGRQMSGGGYEALLHHLLSFDLGEADVRKRPVTAGLRDQKILSFSHEQGWWHQKLVQGEVIEGEGWPPYVFSSQLAHDFVSSMRAWGSVARSSRTKLGRFMRSVCPPGHDLRAQLPGKYLVVQEDGNQKEVVRPHVYQLPSLADCRRLWDERFGGPYEWAEPVELAVAEPARRF